MSLKLYNSLTRKKESLKPVKGRQVSLYTCGLTVYDYAHVGNLRTYLFEDVLKRVLIYNGYKVEHVENITDVGHLVSDADEGEDKMLKALKREGLKPTKKGLMKLAEKYTKAFIADKEDLNILPPKKYTKATEHVNLMVEMIKKIEANGFTYETSDGLYFDTLKLENYGQLAQLELDPKKFQARVASSAEKRNPQDFALWLKAVGPNAKHVLQWSSPWGKGFPGWHIECSAMSSKYLGKPFDIHCGGIDHLPVHHTNERAQNIAAFGKPIVKTWCHGDFLLFKDKKMAKSAGEFMKLGDLVKKDVDPLAYRYLHLQTHYRQKLSFSWESLQGAANALAKLKSTIAEWKVGNKVSASYEKDFSSAVNDDLNLPKALAVVWDLIADKKISEEVKKKTILKFDEVLGLDLKKSKKIIVPSEVKELISDREKARAEKDWAKADTLRKKITKLGFELDDTPQGTVVKKISS
ncbi:cysteine--tRNA ligase [bacterium]|nr:cysteine--tRNA ligase [bacterium]